ncbi:hypothetical protein [Actinoplanes sp. N902-109]|uniref:hypothetical protein n=1 Tax=Actinoplanes sp. (strain N902-109) TaxID=649831 RepID=UPI0003295A38|nr:hypothetical protein [Actinoplanes sp. N902-109]AGL17463.1 hypothetical protein L083_3953 [Actinoplanes sp. N902-109]
MSRPEPPSPFEPPPPTAFPVLPLTGPPSTDLAEPRRIRLPLITGVAGLAAGALVVGMLWLGTALTGATDRDTGADGHMACDLLHQLPPLTEHPADGTSTARLQAAATLAAVATQDNPGYQPITTHLATARQALQHADPTTAEAELTAARRVCDQL